jgi:hypothetical protein
MNILMDMTRIQRHNINSKASVKQIPYITSCNVRHAPETKRDNVRHAPELCMWWGACINEYIHDATYFYCTWKQRKSKETKRDVESAAGIVI